MHSQFRAVKPALIEHREVERFPVQIQRASIRQNGKATKLGELVDVSIFGCRLSCDSKFADGTNLWLRFDGGRPVPATAIWCKGGLIGCRFEEKLDQELFRSLTLIHD
tara:strand:+ start:4493 stop:4816 length:324 start_codon:yes stop_codon:yes gene_type:complete